MENYKERIIEFIEGRIDPETFYLWFESNPQVLDWLQSMIPQDKTIQDRVEVKIDYILKDLPESKRDELYLAYQDLCKNIDVDRAKKLVDLLNELDTKIVQFTDFINLLLYNFKTVLDNPSKYKTSYVQHMCTGVKELFEKRKPIYNLTKDQSVSNNEEIEQTVKGVIEKYEDSCYKRS